MIRTSALFSVAALAALAGLSQGAIVDPGLSGTTQSDTWSNASLTAGANPGYPSFPGSAPWPSAIGSSAGADATLSKTSGSAYPAGTSLYFGGFSATPNASGATLKVADSTPVVGITTVIFQIEIGEAYGYDFYNHVLPTLSYNGGSQNLAATSSALTGQVNAGSFDTPDGTQPLYNNTYLLYWDLSAISGPITDFSISFTGVQHAQLLQMRLDQSTAALSSSPVPEPAAISLLALGAGAALIRRRR